MDVFHLKAAKENWSGSDAETDLTILAWSGHTGFSSFNELSQSRMETDDPDVLCVTSQSRNVV